MPICRIRWGWPGLFLELRFIVSEPVGGLSWSGRWSGTGEQLERDTRGVHMDSAKSTVDALLGIERNRQVRREDSGFLLIRVAPRARYRTRRPIGRRVSSSRSSRSRPVSSSLSGISTPAVDAYASPTTVTSHRRTDTTLYSRSAAGTTRVGGTGQANSSGATESARPSPCCSRSSPSSSCQRTATAGSQPPGTPSRTRSSTASRRTTPVKLPSSTGGSTPPTAMTTGSTSAWNHFACNASQSFRSSLAIYRLAAGRGSAAEVVAANLDEPSLHRADPPLCRGRLYRRVLRPILTRWKTLRRTC